MSAILRQWPRRRWLLAAAAFPVLVFLFAAAGSGNLAASTASWWTWPWLILNSVLASVVVASYLALPRAGKIIDVGCSPCAAVAGLALVAALMVHSSAPASPVMALVASALTAFALRQRLTDADSCPAPTTPGAESASSPQTAASPRTATPSSTAKEEPPAAYVVPSDETEPDAELAGRTAAVSETTTSASRR